METKSMRLDRGLTIVVGISTTTLQQNWLNLITETRNGGKTSCGTLMAMGIAKKVFQVKGSKSEIIKRIKECMEH
jgi:hypothetical protein